MGAGQGGMAAKVHLNCGREPAEVVAVILFEEEGGFREVHLLGHGLHPCRLPSLGKKADRRRVARKGFFRKSINLINRDAHFVPSWATPPFSGEGPLASDCLFGQRNYTILPRRMHSSISFNLCFTKSVMMSI